MYNMWPRSLSKGTGAGWGKTNYTKNDMVVHNHQQTSLHAFAISCLLLVLTSLPAPSMEPGLDLSLASHLVLHREPSELQGMGALEATAWALKVAEQELGVTPVLSAQAVVVGSDPLGLIAYLSHFHSAFKNMPHSSGE